MRAGRTRQARAPGSVPVARRRRVATAGGRGGPRRSPAPPPAPPGRRSGGLAWSRTASMTVGQDSPSCRPAAATVAHVPSTTRPPASRRNRVVTRARAGTAGSDSVNEPRSHNGSRQYQRRLTHTSRNPADPHGRSRGRVRTTSLTRPENTPHAGHAAAVSSAVTTHATRDPSACRSTRSTAIPSRSSSNVASLVSSSKPVTPGVLIASEQPRSPGLRVFHVTTRGPCHTKPTLRTVTDADTSPTPHPG